jgi:hypothetical protein
MLNPKIAKIQDFQLVLIKSQKKYDIHDIAFIEIVKEELKFRKYIFLTLFLLNVVFYFNTRLTTFFLNIFIISVLILVFIFKINPSKYYLSISFKEFKYIKVPLQKKNKHEAENLIKEYKIEYKIIDEIKLNEKSNKKLSGIVNS